MDIQQLTRQFSETFSGALPAGVCRVPGRVNLIGEHVDYSGLSVLPLAIDRCIGAAFRPRKDQTVRIVSDNAACAPTAFELSGDIEPGAPGDWSNYVRAAIQALNTDMKMVGAPGMDLLITSDLPAASGLSSSTALVVAAALAYLSCGNRSLDEDTDRKTLAEILAAGERYIGTQSGGMDQAVILLGQKDHALKIDFGPLRFEPIPIPADYAIVVCNSGAAANKGGAAQSAYNRGPAYCRLIRAMVERHAQQEFGDEIEFASLGEIWSGPLCLTHSEAAELFEGAIAKERYSIAEIANILGIDEPGVREQWLNGLPELEDGLPLQAWSRHQYQELRRVERTRDALLCNDTAAAGKLMLESHASCAEGLGVSTPELNSLVDAAMASGAFGARLTGAGFGGCTVNLVPKSQVASFREGVWTRHYVEGPGKASGMDSADRAIFEVTASDGASYV